MYRVLWRDIPDGVMEIHRDRYIEKADGFFFFLLLMIRLKRLVQWRLLFLWVTTDKGVSDDESGVLEREKGRVFVLERGKAVVEGFECGNLMNLCENTPNVALFLSLPLLSLALFFWFF